MDPLTQPLPDHEADGYEWPPLPILDPELAATILAERLQHAYDDLETQRLRVVTAAAMGQAGLTRQWLQAFVDQLAAFREHVMADVTKFLQLHLGPRYGEGMTTVAPDATWTTMHQSALASLLVDTYGDFLQRSEEAERTSQAFARVVRRAAGEEIPKIAAGGRTATQVADRLEAKLLTQYGITTVTYRDGSKVPVRAYAQMAARTKSAVAFNAGTLNELHAEGIAYVEVFDGSECGWTGHADPDKANGTVRSVSAAAGHILSHPNCTRAFGGRPDVTSDEEAEAATLSTTPEQRADQAAHDFRAAPVVSIRPAQMRRARLAAKRAQRLLGAREPEQVGAIVDRILRERGLIR